MEVPVPGDRLGEAFFGGDARLPAEYLPGAADIGLARSRVVLWQRAVHKRTGTACQLKNQVGELTNGHLDRVTQVDGLVVLDLHQTSNPRDQVIDILKAAGLGAISEEGQRLSGEGLIDEGWHDPPIVDPVAWAIGIEDSYDPGIEIVRSTIGHGDGLGVAFGLIVDRPGPDRIDVAPIGFRLWMDERIAIDFRSGGQEERGSLGSGKFQGVVGTEGSDLKGLKWKLEVVDRTGRAGQMKNPIDGSRDSKRLTDVQLLELEPRMGSEMRQVSARACQQVVDDHDRQPIVKQAITQMAADEPGASGQYDSHSVSLFPGGAAWPRWREKRETERARAFLPALPLRRRGSVVEGNTRENTGLTPIVDRVGSPLPERGSAVFTTLVERVKVDAELA